MMPLRARLTFALLNIVAVCAAMGQDPYAPQAGQPMPSRQAMQYSAPEYSAPPYQQPQFQQPAYQQPAYQQPRYAPAQLPYQPAGQPTAAAQYGLPPPPYAPVPQYSQEPQQAQAPAYRQAPSYAQNPQYSPPPQTSQPAGRQPLLQWQTGQALNQAAQNPPAQNLPAQYQPAPNQAVQNQTLRYPFPQVGTPTASNGNGAEATASAAASRGASPALPVVQPANKVVTVNSAAGVPEAAASEGELFKPGQIVARVGDKSILYADVAATVEMRLQVVLAKARTPAERQALEAAYREPLTKNVIEQAVFNKLLLMEFERGIPADMKSDPKKKKEMEGKLRKQIRNNFEQMLTACREKVDAATPEELEGLMKQDSTMVRLAMLMKERHLDSYGELDMALKEYGTSLEQQVRDYGEYMMGMEAARIKINGDDGPKGKGGKGPAQKKEVTYDDLLTYYQAHLSDYYIPAKARFEILTAKFSQCGGDRQKAWALIVQMGNEVFLGGIPFPAVARKYSHEPHASDGGYYDWVTPGGLASKPIDQAIFSLEVDKLSQIIEDEQGYHIVHVLERKEAGQISFQEAQPKIREKIEKQRKDEIQTKYLSEVRTKAKVWTIYDPPEGAPAPAASERR